MGNIGNDKYSPAEEWWSLGPSWLLGRSWLFDVVTRHAPVGSKFVSCADRPQAHTAIAA